MNFKTLLEGGGNTIIKGLRGEKIPLKEIGRSNFIKKFQELFKEINDIFYREYKEYIWKDFNLVKKGLVFNGSTSFIMDDGINDDDIIPYKSSSGDVDIMIPRNLNKKFFLLMKKLEGKEIIKDTKFIGFRDDSFSDNVAQFISLFKVTFNDLSVFCQIDFELSEFEDDKPIEWTRFARSSSLSDAKFGLKGVAHKYLLSAITGVVSARDDIILITDKSTPEKVRLKKVDDPEVRFLKFSVDKGVRTAYEQQFIDGKPWIIDGKFVYKEIPTQNSTYTQNLEEIFKLLFGNIDNKNDIKKMWSFMGILELMKKYIDKSEIDKVYKRLVDYCFSKKAQIIDKIKDLDLQVKTTMIKTFADYFKINTSNIQSLVDEYYKNTFISENFSNMKNISNMKDISNMKFSQYLYESTRLDIAIKTADSFLNLKTPKKAQERKDYFLNTDCIVEAKTDGVKLTVLKIKNNGNIDDYIFAYKGKVLFQDEFDYNSDDEIKNKSIGNSQFKIVFQHFSKLGKTNIPLNTELQIEFLLKKPTLSSNYKFPHGMVLIGYTTSSYTLNFGKLATSPGNFETSLRENYAKELKINTPLKIYEGKLRDLKSSNILKIKNDFNNLSDDEKISEITRAFLEVESQFGGKEEGVVLKFPDVYLKIQQIYQTDQVARAKIKEKYKMGVDDENTYWKNVKDFSEKLIKNYDFSKNIQFLLNNLSNDIKSSLIPFSHSKKSLTNIKDDIQETAREIIYKNLKGNNNALFLGKFRILTNMHYKIIDDMRNRFDKAVVCMVNSAETKTYRNLRLKMLKACFDDIIIIEHNTGYIKGIIDKSPVNINYIVCGTDRFNDYKRQVKGLGIEVQEIKRDDSGISASKVQANLDDYKFFKDNTPRQIHKFYNEICEVFKNN